MKLPKKLPITPDESKELKAIKQTLNDLLDFHYEVHATQPNKHFHPRFFKKNGKEKLDPKHRRLKKAIMGKQEGKQFSMVGDEKQSMGGGGC